MPHPPKPKKTLSALAALDGLRDQCAYVEECKNELQSAIDTRNRLIIDARLAHIPYAQLAAITGLSRERLSAIAALQRPDALPRPPARP